MKFLIFNIAVAAALIFLFTADKVDLQVAVTQAHEAAGEVKKIARKIAGDGRSLIRKAAGDVEEKAPVVEAPKPVAPEPVAPPPAPVRLAKAPEAIAAPPPLPPEVAARRAEILSGVMAPETGSPVLKQGEKLMTSSERRRELLSLAEEMELLYARSLGQ
jgi:hypothetical protein